jgi:uncharacterized protein (DUF488 family)
MSSQSFLKLPEKSLPEQRQSKITWNRNHCPFGEADFYTIGYSGRTIQDFMNVLLRVNVATLVDIRFTPISQYKPEFSKTNLQRILEENGIAYIHRPEWGVPRDIRAFSIGKETRDDIWNWYDAHVLPDIAKKNVDEFFNSMEHPIALMCTEYDPTECHRHRIALGFERLGLIGCDL